MDTIQVKAPVYHRVTKVKSSRRFYSNELSEYLTFKDIEELTLKGETVRVFCRSTRKEITNSVLFKILLRKSAFSVKDLMSIIKIKDALSNEGK